MPDFLMRYARLPACVAALLGLLAGTSGCGLWGSPLDVILVMVDGARSERFGSYGADPTTTPALDAFATDAAIFSYAWSTSCASAPALASALTGKYATSHGATTQDERVPDSVATLAELVADRGYATSAFRSGDAAPAASGAFQGYPVRDVDRAPALTDAALDWLKAVARERPVHALLVYGDLPAASRDADGADAPPTTPRDAAALAERYGTALRTTDEQIGRFLDGLRASGRYENALIVVAGTHGEALGEHGVVGHGQTLYEEVLRVPLLIRYPAGVSSSLIVEAPTSLVDLLPVVADEIGLSLPGDIEGMRVGERDLVLAECPRDPAMVAAHGARVDRDLFAAIRFPWKLIVSDRDEPELYDLSAKQPERDNRFQTARGVAIDLSRAVNQARTELRPPGATTLP